MEHQNISPRYKNILFVFFGTGLLLLIPLIAMQFTNEVVWSASDFAAAGVLLAGSGLVYELAVRRAGNISYRFAAGIGVGASLFLIWSNLAVGLIGSESTSANLLYLGVIGTGIIGSVIARFDPKGMSLTMFAMAIAQVLVPLIAVIIWDSLIGSMLGTTDALLEIVFVTGFFVVLFTASGLLFRRAAVKAGE